MVRGLEIHPLDHNTPKEINDHKFYIILHFFNIIFSLFLASMTCKLSCVADDTGEIYVSQRFVTDGTPVSYTYPEIICIDGQPKVSYHLNHFQ